MAFIRVLKLRSGASVSQSRRESPESARASARAQQGHDGLSHPQQWCRASGHAAASYAEPYRSASPTFSGETMDSSPTPPEFSKTRATLRDERASTPEDLWSNVEASVNGGSAASSGPAKAAPVAKRASTSETVHHVAGGNLGKRPAPASSSQPGG
ncbi:unnamed protein product, partial [Phaeothamnion confervicola]